MFLFFLSVILSELHLSQNVFAAVNYEGTGLRFIEQPEKLFVKNHQTAHAVML